MDIKTLEIFDQKSFTGKSTKSPVITINPTNGNFSLNTALVVNIGLEHAQQISFSRNKETGNWYLMKTSNQELKNGFAVRVYDTKSHATFTCKSLANMFFKDSKLKLEKSFRYEVLTDNPIPAGDYMCYELDLVKTAGKEGK